jgi:biotin transporter BioY
MMQSTSSHKRDNILFALVYYIFTEHSMKKQSVNPFITLTICVFIGIIVMCCLGGSWFANSAMVMDCDRPVSPQATPCPPINLGDGPGR